MLLRRVNSGLLGARHLCGGSSHGCGQGGGSACLTDAAHSPSSPWISWTHRLLQEVHSRIWRHRCPVDTVTQMGVLLMVIRSDGGLRRPQERPHISAGTAATGFRQAVRRRLRCLQLRLWRGTSPERWSTGILQSRHCTAPRQAGGVRTGTHWPHQSGAPLAAVSLDTAVRGAHRPLQPQIPLGLAAIDNPATRLGEQALRISVLCRVQTWAPERGGGCSVSAA
jgi:hypothetical protein